MIGKLILNSNEAMINEDMFHQDCCEHTIQGNESRVLNLMSGKEKQFNKCITMIMMIIISYTYM